MKHSFTGKAAPPVINAVDTSTGALGETKVVNIQGTCLTVATKSSVCFGAGISINGVTLMPDGSLEVAITIIKKAATGPRTVTVTTPGRTASLPGAFTVN